MVAALFDRVKETTVTTGAGAITLAGAPSGFRTFASVLVDGSSVPYVIEQGTNWEVGRGTYHSGLNTLSRTTVDASSNAGNLVNFGSGTKQIALVNSASLHKLAEQSDVLLTTVARGDEIQRGATEWNNLAIGSVGQVKTVTDIGAGVLEGRWATPTPGITDHGALTGLDDDDHASVYFNQARGDARYSQLGHTHSFASLTSKPTTLSGYGITDAFTQAAADALYSPLGHNHNGVYQPLDTQLTDLAGISYAGNALKVVRVNAGETGFELATPFSQAAADTLYSPLGHTHAFASLTSKPTTIAGYGITDAFTQTAADALYSALGHTHTFASLTSKPTTLVGYGITDGQFLDATLTALAAYNTNGLLTQTAADTFTGRTITGTATRIAVTNGDGVAGNPTLDIDAAYVGQTSIITLGTIGTGVWSGTAIGPTKGGTGLATYTQGDILYSSAANTLAALAAGTDGKILTARGAAANPSWGTLAVGTAGTDFAYAYSAGTHTFNLPDASATARGVVTTGAQAFAGGKTFSTNPTITNTAPGAVFTDTTASAKSLTVAVDANVAQFRESAGASGSLLTLDLANNSVLIGTASPSTARFKVKDAGATGDYIVEVHTDDQNPYIAGFFNDNRSASVPVFEYFGFNNGEFRMGSPAAYGVGLYVNGAYTTPQFYLSASSNFGFNQTTFGTSASKVLAIGSGTAPSTSPADAVQMWSADRGGTAGKASLHLRTEDGTSHVFGDLVGIGTITPSYQFHLYKSVNAPLVLAVENPNAGVAAQTNVVLFNDAGHYIQVGQTGANYPAGGFAAGDVAYFSTNCAGGFSLVSGTENLRFYAGDFTTQRAIITSAGKFGVACTPTSLVQFAGTTSITGGSVSANNLNGVHCYFASDVGWISSAEEGVAWRTLHIDCLDLLLNTRSSGNVGVGQSTFGTSAAKVLAIGSGTAPGSSPADAAQIYSADVTAGNAAIHTRTEGGAIIKLFQAPAIVDTTGAILLTIEAEVNKIKQLLRNNGLLAA